MCVGCVCLCVREGSWETESMFLLGGPLFRRELPIFLERWFWSLHREWLFLTWITHAQTRTLTSCSNMGVCICLHVGDSLCVRVCLCTPWPEPLLLCRWPPNMPAVHTHTHLGGQPGVQEVRAARLHLYWTVWFSETPNCLPDLNGTVTNCNEAFSCFHTSKANQTQPI